VILKRFIRPCCAEYPEMEEILPPRLPCAMATSPCRRLEFKDQQALLEESVLIDPLERF